MPLTKEHFQQLDPPDLLLNIWSNADKKNDPISKQYTEWNIEIALKFWKPEYQNFQDVIQRILKKDKSLNLGEISSDEKTLIYYLIYKDNF